MSMVLITYYVLFIFYILLLLYNILVPIKTQTLIPIFSVETGTPLLNNICIYLDTNIFAMWLVGWYSGTSALSLYKWNKK